jgi:hypothetical protein
MNVPTIKDDMVTMPFHEFEELLEHVVERGARSALSKIGLGDEHASVDVHELRSLLSCLRQAKSTAWQTIVKAITTGVLAALLLGLAIKLKIFGGAQ